MLIKILIIIIVIIIFKKLHALTKLVPKPQGNVLSNSLRPSETTFLFFFNTHCVHHHHFKKSSLHFFGHTVLKTIQIDFVQHYIHVCELSIVENPRNRTQKKRGNNYPLIWDESANHLFLGTSTQIDSKTD